MEDDPKSAAKKARYHPQTERLMRQFLSTDGPKGASEEFRTASCWCECGKLKSQEHGDFCEKCAVKMVGWNEWSP